MMPTLTPHPHVAKPGVRLRALCVKVSSRTRISPNNPFTDTTAQSLLEVALVAPVFVLMLIGAVDFGRAYYAGIEVQAAAEAGALYGTQNVTDTAGMIAAAHADATDVPTLAPAAAWGCECSDGSGATPGCTATPACTTNVVQYVTVTTAATYNAILRYPGVPASLALSGTATMRASQ